MTAPIAFTIFMRPVSVQKGARATAVNGRVRFYNDRRKASYYAQIKALCRPYVPDRPLQGALVVDLAFYMDRPKRRKFPSDGPQPHDKKPDRINLGKGFEDALKDCGFWGDDAQIHGGDVRKWYCGVSEEPRIEVRITAVTEQRPETETPKKTKRKPKKATFTEDDVPF